jgi:plasmid stabilization system protein ParE
VASVTWSPDSLVDLEQVVRDLARESGRAAEDLAESIIAMTDLLGEYPYLGRVFEDIPGEDIRVLVVRRHRLFYRIQTGDVEITRIIHAARRIRPSDLTS